MILNVDMFRLFMGKGIVGKGIVGKTHGRLIVDMQGGRIHPRETDFL